MKNKLMTYGLLVIAAIVTSTSMIRPDEYNDECCGKSIMVDYDEEEQCTDGSCEDSIY
ncbi:MAG TPA: hypothetical protein VLB80_04815 [Candidatus Babeliales bacterium]|nr:hypothetical protein [Candidatus Babeliales bacterium]